VTPADRNLLLRVARRLEDRAAEDYRMHLATGPNPKTLAEARRRRDRETGDAQDLREYVKCTDAAQSAARVPIGDVA